MRKFKAFLQLLALLPMFAGYLLWVFLRFKWDERKLNGNLSTQRSSDQKR